MVKDVILQRIIDYVNAVLVLKEPSWRYFEHKVKGSNLWYYCWTTEKSRYRDKMSFLAFVIKWTGNRGKRVKTVAFAKRWKAKDRAYKWYCKATGKEFTSCHKTEGPPACVPWCKRYVKKHGCNLKEAWDAYKAKYEN